MTDYLAYRELFKRAIMVYEMNQLEVNRHIWHYIHIPEYSILPELKVTIEEKREIPDRALKLLGIILSEYRSRLPELKQREWIKAKGIEDEINLLNKLEKDVPNLLPKQTRFPFT